VRESVVTVAVDAVAAGAAAAGFEDEVFADVVFDDAGLAAHAVVAWAAEDTIRAAQAIRTAGVPFTVLVPPG
jgi:hypothetical protein